MKIEELYFDGQVPCVGDIVVLAPVLIPDEVFKDFYISKDFWKKVVSWGSMKVLSLYFVGSNDVSTLWVCPIKEHNQKLYFPACYLKLVESNET
mgnify:FL=1